MLESAVGRSVVHEHDPRQGMGLRRERLEALDEHLSAVVGDDDRDDCGGQAANVALATLRPMPSRDFWSGRRVLVTGHSGFKGSWLSLWLQSLGAEVAGYSLDPPTSPCAFEL